MQQTDSAWVLAGKAAAVLAAPGYCGAMPERVARAFVVAAAKAGADAVELPAGCCTPDAAALAARHGLRVVAAVTSAADVAAGAAANADAFRLDSSAQPDAALLEALASAGRQVLVSSAPGGPNPHAHDIAARLAELGAAAILLHPHETLVARLQAAIGLPQESFAQDGAVDAALFGCDAAAGDMPLAVDAVIAAASGVALVRRHLAIARYFGQEDSARHLSLREFREMVASLRAAERIIGRTPAPARARDRLAADPRDRMARLAARETQTIAGPATAIVASELVATVAAVVDLTQSPDLPLPALQLLLGRLRGARTVDRLCALATGREAARLREALAAAGIDCRDAGESWLADVLAIAERASADALAWVPGRSVLADPSLLDRMTVQHVKSSADLTRCSEAPRGLAATVISVGALRRIAAFTGGAADAQTVLKLLANRRVFRVQETTLDEHMRRPDVDLTWRMQTDGLIRKLARTGTEPAAELVERYSLLGADAASSESVFGEPFSTCITVTHGENHTSTF